MATRTAQGSAWLADVSPDMKLQHKAWALVLAIVSLAALGSMLGVRGLVVDSFETLEAERAGREGERARRLLDQQLADLGMSVKDYAHWGEAVSFARREPSDFMQDNFAADSLANLRFSEVLVFDALGQLVSGVQAVSSERVGAVAPKRVAQLKALVQPVLNPAASDKALQTYLAGENRLDMVAAVAIRDPDDLAATHGVLVLVRHFDQEAIQRFSDVLMVPARLEFDSSCPGDAPAHLVPSGALHHDLHTVVQGAGGEKVTELVLTLEKDLQKMGGAMVWQTMAVVLFFGLLACVLLVVLLNHLLLRRLQRLHGEVQGVTRKGPLVAGAVHVQGNDELSQLGEGVNGLLDRVRTDARAQEVAHARQEALQQALMQSQKTEALGRFTSGIAHDFNNALAATTGWMRLAMEDLDKDHPAHESLQHALKGSRHASSLVKQLQAYNGKAAPVLQRLSVGDLIEPSFSLLAPSVAKHCELVVECRSEQAWVKADPTQLQQVLANLMSNAADAIDGRGKISVVVDVIDLPAAPGAFLVPEATALPAGRYVTLAVGDEGPGIAPENFTRIFDPFFTTKPVGRGTGLGLSVSQGILSRHGGAIGVVSQPGQGSTFHVFLPACLDSIEQAVPLPASGNRVSGGRLLFVDDDHLVRTAWSALLEREGWEVTQAVDGEAAWALFQQSEQRWDVVLTDQAMPRLDGVELAQRIRGTAGAPPLVLMSGNVGPEDSARLARGAFAAVLHKPVDPEVLNRVLAEVLGKVSAL